MLQLLLLLLPSLGGTFELRVNRQARHASTCGLSHPHGVWEWAAEVQIGTPPKTFMLQLDSGFHQMTLPNVEVPYVCPEVPMQAYRAADSSTASMYTCEEHCKHVHCEEAKANGTIKCLNCDGSQSTAADACISHTGLDDSGHTNYTWVSDTVRIADVELANFWIGLNNNLPIQNGSTPFRGSWGFKVDPSAADPLAPPWSSMLHDLSSNGAISELSYSMCFNASIGVGRIAFGEMLQHSVSSGEVAAIPELGSRGVVTAEPMRWVDAARPTISASIDSNPIYRYNGTDADTVLFSVDSGTMATSMPNSWAEKMVTQLEANCSSNPLVGVCVDSAGEPIPPRSARSILKGTCHPLTAEQRRAYPDIVFTVPAADSAEPDVLIRYTPTMYLSNFSSPCVRKLLMVEGCEGPDDVLVTWAFMALRMSNDDHDPGHLILGEDLYNSFLSYRSYENNTMGLARIQSCSDDPTVSGSLVV